MGGPVNRRADWFAPLLSLSVSPFRRFSLAPFLPFSVSSPGLSTMAFALEAELAALRKDVSLSAIGNWLSAIPTAS
jgi:hypothetical protein